VIVGHILPSGYYDVEVITLDEEYTKAKSLLMYVVEYRVLAPAAAKGKPFTEYFVIGKSPWTVSEARRRDASDADIAWFAKDDPDAEDPETWIKSTGFRNLKLRLEAAGYPLEDVMDMDIVAQEMVGLKLGLRVLQEVDTKVGSAFYGRDVNVVAASYAVGKEVARLDEAATPAVVPRRKPQSPAQDERPRPSRRFSDDDDGIPF
jgi:hypothetical protein